MSSEGILSCTCTHSILIQHPPKTIPFLFLHAERRNHEEPWLKKIRRFGLDLARTQKIPSDLKSGHQATGDKSEQNKLAEVYETSHQPLSDVDHHAAAAAQQEAQNNTASSEPHGSKRHLAIIACSSLKLVYRRLLRGTISSLADPAARRARMLLRRRVSNSRKTGSLGSFPFCAMS